MFSLKCKNQSWTKLTYAKIARGLNQFAFRINNKNQVVCGINIEKVRIGQNTLNDTLRPNHGYVGQKNKNEELNLQTGPIKMNFRPKSKTNEVLSRDRDVLSGTETYETVIQHKSQGSTDQNRLVQDLDQKIEK